MSAWQLGMFDVLAEGEEAPTVCTTAGWYREPFGVDRRWYEGEDGKLEDVFCITHLPTGYLICAYRADHEDDAKAFIDEIVPLGNWDFVSPLGAKPLSAAMANVFKSNSRVLNPKFCLPALWLRKKERA